MNNVCWAIIPARSGSKGVKDKNIYPLNGKPLISYSIEIALKTKEISRVLVSTDSEQYAKLSRKYGAEIPFLRPEKISGDKSSDYDVIEHLLKWAQENNENLPKFLIHLRPTTPLRKTKVISDAISLISKSENATSLRSIHEMSESAYKTFEVNLGYLRTLKGVDNNLNAANKPRQAFPKTYVGNGYVDIYNVEYVIKNKNLLGENVLAYETKIAPEIDSIDDLKYIEYLLKNESHV